MDHKTRTGSTNVQIGFYDVRKTESTVVHVRTRKTTCRHCFQRSWQFLAQKSLLTLSSSYCAAATRKESPFAPPTRAHTHTRFLLYFTATLSADISPPLVDCHKEKKWKRGSFSDVDQRSHCLARGPGRQGRKVLPGGCESSIGSRPASCVVVRLRRIIVITSVECFDPSVSQEAEGLRCLTPLCLLLTRQSETS